MINFLVAAAKMCQSNLSVLIFAIGNREKDFLCRPFTDWLQKKKNQMEKPSLDCRRIMGHASKGLTPIFWTPPPSSEVKKIENYIWPHRKEFMSLPKKKLPGHFQSDFSDAICNL